MSRDLRRFKIDIKEVVEKYGNEKVFWPKDYSWIYIKEFKLPDNFKESYTDILILVPENYGYGGCFRDIFINPDLNLLDRDGKTYRKLDKDIHGFREFPYMNMSDKMKKKFLHRSWFYLCLHDLDPKSSILNYLFKVKIFLENPYKDWESIKKYRR